MDVRGDDVDDTEECRNEEMEREAIESRSCVMSWMEKTDEPVEPYTREDEMRGTDVWSVAIVCCCDATCACKELTSVVCACNCCVDASNCCCSDVTSLVCVAAVCCIC